MKKILIAPDKFKGSLTGEKVALSIKKGLLKASHNLGIVVHPLADGGDGSLAVLKNHLELSEITVASMDPLGREIMTSYYISDNGEAFIEVASASGLVLLAKSERNPEKTSSRGTGLIIADALKNGAESIYLFLGGSATNDAGTGILHELGFRFLDTNQNVLPPNGENLCLIDSIVKPEVNTYINCKFHLLCDVNNTLYGKKGAAFVFAGQKGASFKSVQKLDDGLKNFSRAVEKQLKIDISKILGGGAAGGIGAGLYGMLNAQIKSGIDTILYLTNFEEQLKKADIIITGEGSLDQQTLNGKVISGIAKLAQEHQKQLVIISGINQLNPEDMKQLNPLYHQDIMSLTSNKKDAFKYAARFISDIAFQFAKKHL